MQTNILAKTDQLFTLDNVDKHAPANEAAQRDQAQIQSNAENMAFQSNTHGQ